MNVGIVGERSSSPLTTYILLTRRQVRDPPEQNTKETDRAQYSVRLGILVHRGTEVYI